MTKELIQKITVIREKQHYIAPQLTIFGKIESITRGTGNNRDTDGSHPTSCEGGTAGVCGS